MRPPARLRAALAAGLLGCLWAADAHAFPELEVRPIETRPVALASKAAFETYLDRLMIAESGGRDGAANPRSSALGPYQFIKSTFLELVRRYFPAETDELSEEEVLELRVNRSFARRAAAIYSRESLALLTAQGLVPTFGHLRLAFLVGPSAAVRLIRAVPDTPVSEVLGPAVVKANPFMSRLSAAELIARAARDISDDRNSLITAAPAPHARPVAAQPEPRRTGRAVDAYTIVREPKGAATATCNRRLASCRRWISLQANKQRVISERARSLSKGRSRVGNRGGRPGA